MFSERKRRSVAPVITDVMRVVVHLDLKGPAHATKGRNRMTRIPWVVGGIMGAIFHGHYRFDAAF